MTGPEPKLLSAEWAAIRRVLPKPGGPGRPPHDDRLAVAQLLYGEAMAWSWDSLQHLYGRARAGTLIQRRLAWQRRGIWPAILAAGEPAVTRLRREKIASYGEVAVQHAKLLRQW